MRIIIDDKEDLVSAEEGAKLADILEQLRTWLKGHHLAITDLILDGEILTAKRRDELGKVAVEAFSVLDVSTIDPLKLSLQTLTEVKKHLEPLAQSLVEITEAVQRGDLQQAWMKLTMSFDVWSVIIEAVDKTARLAEVDLQAFSVNDAPLGDRMTELKNLLEKAKTAMEEQDIVAVGDLMEYEFSPRVKEWSDVIDTLCREIEKRQADRGS